MDLDEIAKKYVAAWNQKDVSGVLELTHSQVSFYDAFWGEISTGKDLQKYLQANFELETRWYRLDGDPLMTPNGLVMRYIAYHRDDPDGEQPLFTGAEVITVVDGRIMTISDFYCDPEPVDLIEIARLAEQRHSQAHIAPLGLSAKVSGRIKSRLANLAVDMTLMRDPSLTVTRLADGVECSVMHLFHVLEEEKGMTFTEFVSESRARYATTLLLDSPCNDFDLRRVAEMSGFASVNELHHAFQVTFGMAVDEYVQQFRSAPAIR